MRKGASDSCFKKFPFSLFPFILAHIQQIKIVSSKEEVHKKFEILLNLFYFT